MRFLVQHCSRTSRPYVDPELIHQAPLLAAFLVGSGEQGEPGVHGLVNISPPKITLKPFPAVLTNLGNFVNLVPLRKPCLTPLACLACETETEPAAVVWRAASGGR